jgi:hypothetical protein
MKGGKTVSNVFSEERRRKKAGGLAARKAHGVTRSSSTDTIRD